MEPYVEQMKLPEGYGEPSRTLEWEQVEAKLELAPVYWLSSTRPDGRPHVVPRDGVWLDGALWYGGGTTTIHNRNVAHDPRVAAHIGDGMEAVIVEGESRPARADSATAARLSEAAYAKYPQYGPAEPDAYMSGDALKLTPDKVLAWNELFTDATRFVFAPSG